MNDNGDDSGMIKVVAQDVMLVPAWALQMPDACSSCDPEAEERGCHSLSYDISSSQDGLLSILSVAFASVECRM